MQLRSGHKTQVCQFSSENIDLDQKLQDCSSAALHLNEVMMRHVTKINNEKNKTDKLHHIMEFYLFLKESENVMLVTKYNKLITIIVEKTREHMDTLEDEYFQEMVTKQQKDLLFECYYTLSTVRRLYKNYLCSLRFTMASSSS